MYQYEGSDANGYALELRRATDDGLTAINRNTGFTQFECNEYSAIALKGRYKFSGSSIEGVVDTLRIAVSALNAKDTLTSTELHLGTLPSFAKVLNITTPTDTFKTFEIDMSDFLSTDVDYMLIQLELKYGNAGSFTTGHATAVLDDLELVPTNLITGLEEESPISVYPNPAADYLIVKEKSQKRIKTVQIYSVTGKLLHEDRYEESMKIELSNFPSGSLFIKLLSDSGDAYIKKIIRQ